MVETLVSLMVCIDCLGGCDLGACARLVRVRTRSLFAVVSGTSGDRRAQVVSELASAVARRVERARWSLATAHVEVNRKQVHIILQFLSRCGFLGNAKMPNIMSLRLWPLTAVLRRLQRFLARLLQSLRCGETPSRVGVQALQALWTADGVSAMDTGEPVSDRPAVPSAAVEVLSVRRGGSHAAVSIIITLQNIGATSCVPAVSLTSVDRRPLLSVSQCRPTSVVSPGATTTCTVVIQSAGVAAQEMQTSRMILLLHPNGRRDARGTAVIGTTFIDQLDRDTATDSKSALDACNVSIDFVCLSKTTVVAAAMHKRAQNAGWIDTSDEVARRSSAPDKVYKCGESVLSTWNADGCEWLRLSAESSDSLTSLAREVGGFLPEDAVVVAASSIPFDKVIDSLRHQLTTLERDIGSTTAVLLAQRAIDEIYLA